MRDLYDQKTLAALNSIARSLDRIALALERISNGNLHDVGKPVSDGGNLPDVARGNVSNPERLLRVERDTKKEGGE